MKQIYLASLLALVALVKSHSQVKEEIAYFADACFWCTEGIWESIDGVSDVISGYMGGTHPKHPTYQSHGNYAEGNKIVYDATVISYEELAEIYFLAHSHGRSPDKGPSYRAVAFAKDKAQEEILLREYNKEVDRYGREFQQEIIVGSINWYDGEDYHQDYIQRLEDGEYVPNSRYGRGESIPRRDRALKKIKANQKPKGMKVIKFSATWCGPCRVYAPKFEAWAESNPDIETESIDVDADQETAAKYGVRNIPVTVVVDSEGNKINSAVGVLSADDLNKLIAEKL